MASDVVRNAPDAIVAAASQIGIHVDGRPPHIRIETSNEHWEHIISLAFNILGLPSDQDASFTEIARWFRQIGEGKLTGVRNYSHFFAQFCTADQEGLILQELYTCPVHSDQIRGVGAFHRDLIARHPILGVASGVLFQMIADPTSSLSHAIAKNHNGFSVDGWYRPLTKAIAHADYTCRELFNALIQRSNEENGTMQRFLGAWCDDMRSFLFDLVNMANIMALTLVSHGSAQLFYWPRQIRPRDVTPRDVEDSIRKANREWMLKRLPTVFSLFNFKRDEVPVPMMINLHDLVHVSVFVAGYMQLLHATLIKPTAVQRSSGAIVLSDHVGPALRVYWFDGAKVGDSPYLRFQPLRHPFDSVDVRIDEDGRGTSLDLGSSDIQKLLEFEILRAAKLDEKENYQDLVEKSGALRNQVVPDTLNLSYGEKIVRDLMICSFAGSLLGTRATKGSIIGHHWRHCVHNKLRPSELVERILPDFPRLIGKAI